MPIARQDTFNRADVPSGLGTATDGNVWTVQSGNGQSVSGNKAVIANSTASTFATLGGNLPTADGEALARVALDAGSSNPTAGLILRWTDANNLWLCRFNGATNQWNLMVKQSGTYTSLTPTLALTPVMGSYYWLRYRAQGTTHSFKVWKDGDAEPGSWSVSLTDARQNVIGKTGLYGYADGLGGNWIDDFAVDDLVTGVTQTGSAAATGTGNAALSANVLPAGVAIQAAGKGNAALIPTAQAVGSAAATGTGTASLTAVNAKAAPGTGIATLSTGTKSQSWSGGPGGSPGTEYTFTSKDSANSGWRVGGIPTYGGMPLSSWYAIDSNTEGVNQTTLATSVPDGWVHWLEQDTSGNFAGSENPTWTKTDLDAGSLASFRAYYRATATALDALGFQWTATACIYPGDPGFIAFRFDLTNPSGSAKALASSDSLEVALIAGLQQTDGTWLPSNGGYGTVGGANTVGWPGGAVAKETDYVYITPTAGKASDIGLLNVKKTKLSGAGSLGWSGVEIQYLQNATRLKLKIMGTYTSFPAGATQTFYAVNVLKRSLTASDAQAIAADFLTPGTPTGSAFTGFNYDERLYTFDNVVGNTLTTTFDLAGGVTRRYKPVLRAKWTTASAPTLTWGGATLVAGTDYQYAIDTAAQRLYIQLGFDIVTAASGNAGERVNAQLIVTGPGVQTATLAATAGGNATLTPRATYRLAATAAAGGGDATLTPTTKPAIPDVPPGGLRVIHAGQDITPFVDEFSIDLTSILGQGAGSGAGGSGQGTTCSFLARLGPAATAIGKGQRIPLGDDIVRQGAVSIYDGLGQAVFGGFVTRLDDATDSINPVTKFTCVDGWQHLDRTEVFELYTGAGDGDIIRDLCQKYAPWLDTSLVPAVNTYTFERRACKGTLRAALQSIANTTGWYIWVDPAFVLHYVAPTAAQTAPFELSDDANSLTTFPHHLTSYEVNDNDIINRVYFYGGKNTSPDFTQDLSVQANGANKVFLLAYAPENATDGHKHIILNGMELVVGSIFDTSTSGKLKSDGGDADVLLNAGSKVAIFDVAPLKTDTLIAIYRYQTPLVVVLSNQQSHNFYGDWYDGRITDSNVFDVHNALQRCRVLLAEQSYGLVSLEATVWKAGLQAGQLLRIHNGVRGIDDSYLIQKVAVKPLGGGQFEYHLTCGAWDWNLLDILIQSARILNPTDGNSEEDMTVIQAREALVSTTAAIAITTSTHASGQYYSGQPDTLSGFFTVTG